MVLFFLSILHTRTQDIHSQTNKTNSTMKALLEKIYAEAQAFGKDAALQLNKGNKAAGARARKAALDLMKDLKEFRKVSVAEAKK